MLNEVRAMKLSFSTMSLLVVMTALPASANLNVNLSFGCSQLQCSLSTGEAGGPESASANFDPNAPGWSFSFQSALPVSWSESPFSYHAAFGPGGNFSMTAPGGLTFTGTLTSGGADSGSGHTASVTMVDAFFVGQWSNGLPASGEAGISELDAFGHSSFKAKLTTAITPEPSSLALFCSGIVLLGRVIGRKVNDTRAGVAHTSSGRL